MIADGHAGLIDSATANRKHHVKVLVQVKVLTVACAHIPCEDERVGTVRVLDFRLDVFHVIDDWGGIAGANPPVK